MSLQKNKDCFVSTVKEMGISLEIVLTRKLTKKKEKSAEARERRHGSRT